jgi:type 1 glutamine amidotransferase
MVIEANAQESTNWKRVKVLVYTRNGKGYVHENIPYAVASIQQLGKKHGFKVDSSSNPAVMTRENLKQYTVLVFPSTNNDVFDNDGQRLAFRQYIEAGGGFVGVHSVVGTERNWKWFKMMLGGTFAWHANFQSYRLRMIDGGHPSMQGLPKAWQKEDECYFLKELYPGPKTLMAQDITSLDTTNADQKSRITQHAGGYAAYYPAVWTHDFDGGYTWCTTLGHDKKDYSDPVFTQHLLQGIRYIASRVKKIDYTRAYAVTRDDEVKF